MAGDMVFINRLLASPNGWKILIQDRIEKALKETGVKNVTLYPDKDLAKNFHAYECAKFVLYSMHWLLLNNDAILKTGDKLIFLEVYQMPIFQMIYGGLANFNTEVLIHCSYDVSKFKPFDSSQTILEYSKVMPNKIFQTKATADTYGETIGRNKIIGGFLNRFEMCKKEKYVLWTGYRVGDETKDYNKFLQIVKNNSHIKFVACLNQKIDSGNYSNLEVRTGLDSYEFVDVCKKAKYVLSTSKSDSFSYSLFDAISFGAIPLVTDLLQHREWIPEKFIYKDTPDFELKAEPEEMKKIVDYHYYADTFMRLIS
ncbi:MAG: hypothetical protein WC998_07055 [Candidatus Paceibacterota bacterium]|jgi:glycosyltransferase involved in cell wall biosynthesis